MAWPMPQDYSEAVQNPHLTFSDSELKRGQVELDKLGLPIPCTGAFAVVFKIKILPQYWAVKCFTSEISDQQRRYEAISTYLAKVALPYTVPFQYMQNGIKVCGTSYPLLKMEWVKGESLSSFISRSLNYPETLFSLAKVWAKMVGDLKAVNIAHGDLQHGNILVVGDQLKLIDYDGMFVPALARQQSNEIGHRNYQLPSRSRWDFGPYLDNFSAWVIYVSLVALAVHPELWNAHQGGDECLIFREDDFQNPASSALLSDLRSSPNDQLRFLTEMFISFFFLSPQDIPSLDGNLPSVTIEPQKTVAIDSQKPWWGDFVETPAQSEEKHLTEGNGTIEEELTVSNPIWIIDSLTPAKQIERVAFQGRPNELRIVAFGSLALVFLTRFFNEMPASEFVVVVSCIFGLNILLCFIRYRNDPSLADFENFKSEAKDFLSQIREHQTLLDSICAKRIALQEKLAKTERELTEQKNRVSSGLQVELAKLQSELNSQLLAVNQRRQSNQRDETKKISSIQGTLGTQMLDLDKKISSLKQSEVDETNRATIALQENYVKNRLSTHSIANSSIPGIGATYKSRLCIAGVNTAADIDWRIRNVYGIGSARQAALFAWRQALENEARQYVPNLLASDRLAINSKYQSERQRHETAKQALQNELNAQVAGARQFFGDIRRSLNQEEQQIQINITNGKSQIQQDHYTRISDIDAKIIAAKNQAAPIMNELSEKLRTAQKQVFALRWKAAKHEKEGQRFVALRFRDYLHKIISF